MIAKDPSFVPAYAGLAAAHATRSRRFPADIADEVAKMRAAAEKAIQLDPLLAEAHDALGTPYARVGQWEQSQRSFRRAIEIEPSRSLSHSHFAFFLLFPLGRVDEALQLLRVAEKTDPLTPGVKFELAFVLISRGRYDEAADYCEKMPADYPLKRYVLGMARLGQGRIGEVIQVLEPAFNRGLSKGDQLRRVLGCAYAQAGRREEAEKVAADSPGIRLTKPTSSRAWATRTARLKLWVAPLRRDLLI